MAEALARNWWAVALRGVAAILFGLLTILNPALSLAALVLLFGAYALVDGVFGIIGAVTRRRGEPRWVALLISGILGALAVLLWIGVFAVVFGIVLMALAFKLRGWNRDVASRSAATV